MIESKKARSYFYLTVSEISHFTLYKLEKGCYNSLADAPVAQWIEHQIPVLRVGGSSPFRRAKNRVTPTGVSLFFDRLECENALREIV